MSPQNTTRSNWEISPRPGRPLRPIPVIHCSPAQAPAGYLWCFSSHVYARAGPPRSSVAPRFVAASLEPVSIISELQAGGTSAGCTAELLRTGIASVLDEAPSAHSRTSPSAYDLLAVRQTFLSTWH